MTAHDPNETFAPSAEFAAQANVGADEYTRASEDRLAFWDEQARRLDWTNEWSEVLDWSDAPVAKWFVDGKLNASYNCVDRHVEAGNGDRVAIHWIGEPTDDARDITYAELKDEVSRAANYLTSLGLVAGDRVAIYMPLLPETYIAMLACARLGLTHSVVFAGFSSQALRSRVDDAEAKVVITAEEIVPESDIRYNKKGVIIPFFYADAVVELPYGALPGSMPGYYYWPRQWWEKLMRFAAISDENLSAFLDEWVFSTKNQIDVLEKLGGVKWMIEARRQTKAAEGDNEDIDFSYQEYTINNDPGIFY